MARATAERMRASAAVAALLVACVLAGGARALEYSVKAAYLVKFVPFVEWPPRAQAGPRVICVVGDDPFGDRIDKAAAPDGDAPLTTLVRRMPAIGRGSGCHVAYAAGSAAQSPAAILAAVSGEPVLTVTDASRPGDARGIVHLMVLDDRVRFAIDDAQAAVQELKISAKLQDLAVSVRPRPPATP